MMIQDNTNPMVYLPFELLPDAKKWIIGKKYKVRLVLRQKTLDDKSATFEILDAVSLENKRGTAEKYLLSEGGSFKA